MSTSSGRRGAVLRDDSLPPRREVIVAAALMGAAIVEGTLRRDLSWPVVTVAITVVLLAGLPWRRSHPLPLVVAITASTAALDIAQFAAGVPSDGLITMFALILAPYSLFRWGTWNARIIGGIALAAGVLLSALLGPEPGGESIVGAIAGVVFVGTACLLGTLRRERAETREREIVAARAHEREALARDLHDTVAHHVSVIAIRAQGAALAVDDRIAVSESLSVIESEAKTVLDEMRSLVRTLRSAADYAPPAGLSELARLSAVGPPCVTVRIETPDAPSEIVAGTLYRIAQEAVTNARRHAPEVAQISITVTDEGDDLHIRVRDDGRGSDATSASGYGLTGMSERAALLGGTIDAGPQVDGGWLLHARIPRSDV